MVGPGSPTKRSYRPSTTLANAHLTYHSSSNLHASYNANLNSPSRPHTPSLRRPASSVSLRSSTPTQYTRRPATPSLSSFYAQQSASTTSLLSQKENIYSGNIKVSVRVKPPIQSKATVTTSQDGSITTINNHWSIDTDRHAISSKDVGEFSFDNVFHGPIHNSQIFNSSVKELLDQVMAGFNGTVFAYGMTGSGKTYSMQGTQSNLGIIPLSVHAIFDHIKSDPLNSYVVKVSYLEIYNEHLHDLLSPQTQSDDIKLRDDLQRGVRALGLREVTVTTPEDLITTIQNGDALRRTEGTEFNSNSSRSHAVVQITIESTPKNKKIVTVPRSSTLYLCDLAGSERAASKSERRKEGAFINKSLLTLGTVIARLSVASSSHSLPSSNAGHIPYRDSKLTRLLQPALSGKSLVSVLCTLDLCNMNNNMETVSTLRFAARAKNIMVSARRSEESTDPNSKLIEKLQAQVEALKTENSVLRRSGSSQPPSINLTTNGSNANSISNLALASQFAQLEAENRILNERVEHLTRLCDDNRLEELIGLGIDDGSSNWEHTNSKHINGASGLLRPPSSLSNTSAGTGTYSDNTMLEDEWRRKESEYKSYIAHLEKQLYSHEVINRRPNERSPDLLSSSPIFSPSRSNISTSGFPSSQQHYAEVITELKEEVTELKESNSDKDRIISTLRSINRRKENLTALSANNSSTIPNSASSSPPSSLHSPAYSRYYFSTASSTAITSSMLNSTTKSGLGLTSSSASSIAENQYDERTLTEIPVSQ